MTMVNHLAQADMAVGHDFQVYDTSPDTGPRFDEYLNTRPKVWFYCSSAVSIII